MNLSDGKPWFSNKSCWAKWATPEKLAPKWQKRIKLPWSISLVDVASNGQDGQLLYVSVLVEHIYNIFKHIIAYIRVQIAGVHLCNRFIATILGAPIFELQNHVHNPKIASTKCNGFAWLLATNKSAFCSSIIFEPFKDRNAFCTGPFGVQNS